MENFLYFIAGNVVSGFLGWLITHLYYRQQLRDAEQGSHAQLLAQRLDKCNEGDLSFLVALRCHGKPVPRYAIINVDYELRDGTRTGWGSNMNTMVGSLAVRVGQCTVHHHPIGDEDRATVTLTERGKECADYLLKTRYKSARFEEIDDSEAIRRGHFQLQHKRAPKLKKVSPGDVHISVSSEG